MRLGMTASGEIVAVGVPMSAVPRWSRLWTAVDTNGSRLVTWENFAFGRDTNAPVNAQIELRPTGDFVTRSNAVETVCLRVDPEDWDGDGWQNDDDPDPYEPEEDDGPHAAGASVTRSGTSSPVPTSPNAKRERAIRHTVMISRRSRSS